MMDSSSDSDDDLFLLAIVALFGLCALKANKPKETRIDEPAPCVGPSQSLDLSPLR